MIADIGGHFIGAKTPKSLVTRLSVVHLDPDEFYPMVDATGEGWSLYVGGMAISPLARKKRWTKLDIIRLFNQRKNPELAGGKTYSEKSLSAKRFDRIFSDLVKLASEK